MLCLLVVLAGTVAGCRTNKGAQEFIPGRGWVPTR
jgi:predicted small secreted protein